MAKKTKKFTKLQKEWYKKLKESGFEDLEYFYPNGEAKEWLKGSSKFDFFSDNPALDVPSLTYESTLDYYNNAVSKLETTKFDSEEHKEIWRLHSEGMSLRKIGSAFNYSHPKILRILNKYK